MLEEVGIRFAKLTKSNFRPLSMILVRKSVTFNEQVPSVTRAKQI